MRIFIYLFSLLFFYTADSLARTVTVHTSSPAMFPGATGVFKCGEYLHDYKLETKAKPLSCVVIDRAACTGFVAANCKTIEYTYPEYADWRASREKKKVKYLGLAPVHTSGRDHMFIFVEEIPQ